MIYVIAVRREHMINWAQHHDLPPARVRQVSRFEQMQGLRGVDCVIITWPENREQRDYMQTLLRVNEWNVLPKNINEWPLTAFG